MAHQHILGYLVPYDGENVMKMLSYDKYEVTKRRVD